MTNAEYLENIARKDQKTIARALNMIKTELAAKRFLLSQKQKLERLGKNINKIEENYHKDFDKYKCLALVLAAMEAIEDIDLLTHTLAARLIPKLYLTLAEDFGGTDTYDEIMEQFNEFMNKEEITFYLQQYPEATKDFE